MKKLLTKSNPFTSSTCKNPSCCVCPYSRNKICQVRDCVYQLKCNVCQYTYIGETARSLQERMKEHLMLLKNKSKTSILYQQQKEKYGEQDVLWNIAVRARCPKDATLRQASEATIIDLEKPQLNRKVEFGHQNKSRPKKSNND